MKSYIDFIWLIECLNKRTHKQSKQPLMHGFIVEAAIMRGS
jgi:hypothetical protein